MTSNITRREWLVGGTAIAGTIAGTMVASSIASAQTFPDANLNPTQKNPIRAGFNENVYGASLKARKAMDEAVKTSHLYDFRSQFTLKDIISKMENIPTECISPENGSTPFLDKSAYIAAIRQGAILAPSPTYSNISTIGRSLGVKTISVPVREDDMSIDLDAMRAAMTDEVKVIYICNPNNPIPTIIEKNALREFCIEFSKKALIVIDEAYYEYVDNPDFATMADLVVENENIIVLRTASKIHAFAGVRMGFAFSHPETRKLIAGRFNLSLNNVAMKGAIVTYQDIEYQKFIKQKNKESMEILYKMFADLDLKYIKSNTNFTFFNAGRPSKEVAKTMIKHGIITGREFKPFTNWVRISTVKPEEMQYFADLYRKEFG